jgi:cytochrome c biogenesis factor
MTDEHELHPDLTPAVAGSLQHMQDDQQKSGTRSVRDKKMRRTFAVAVAAAVMLASLGAVLASKHHSEQRVTMASSTTISATSADIEARRTDLLRRIDEARNAGQLKGVTYMTLLGEHQSLQVAQRRAEAQGMTEAAVKKLNTDINRMEAQLERYLRTH